MKSAIEYAATTQADDFQALFARMAGWICAGARENPEATCTMKEVGELFNILFERMQGKEAETPAGGAAGESR